MGYPLVLPLDDTSLIEEYVNGNRDAAATAFVRQYQRFVYSLALRYLNQNYDDAHDVTQEVFIRAVTALPGFRKQSSISTWLYRITINVCNSTIRKQRLRALMVPLTVDSDPASPMNNPEQEVLETDFFHQLQALIQRLPPRQRETFCLRYFDELSYEEISSILGTSVGGLKANYFQAVTKLAGYLRQSDIINEIRSEE